jgi:S1-C subfamily serine protease
MLKRIVRSIEQLLNRFRAGPSAGVCRARLASQGAIKPRPAMPPFPVQSPEPRGADLAPGLLSVEDLHPGFVPFGRDLLKVGIPSFLASPSSSIASLFVAIGTDGAAGLRVNHREILTNRHVFDQLAGDPAIASFVGERPLLPGWSGLLARAVPPPLPRRVLGVVLPWDYSTWCDWALLRDENTASHAKPKFRSAHSLRAGELVWIVGGKEGERTEVSVGRIRSIKGVNGMLYDCDVRPGMSGSPVLDAAGSVVALFCVQWGWPGRRAMFVTIDAVARGLDELRRFDPELPSLRIV